MFLVAWTAERDDRVMAVRVIWWTIFVYVGMLFANQVE